MYPVSSVKERNRKGGKSKSLRFFTVACFLYPSLTKVEASNRPKQAQRLPTCGKVQNVLPQVTSVSVHLPSLQAGHGPSGLYSDCKRSEVDGLDKGNQTSPVPGRLADRAQSQQEAQ